MPLLNLNWPHILNPHQHHPRLLQTFHPHTPTPRTQLPPFHVLIAVQPTLRPITRPGMDTHDLSHLQSTQFNRLFGCIVLHHTHCQYRPPLMAFMSSGNKFFDTQFINTLYRFSSIKSLNHFGTTIPISLDL